MQPLVRFVKDLRESAPAPVADFDPYDGGIEAEVLFLLEAPGPQTARTGFMSRDNPDATAKAWLELNAETGLPRERTAIWNAVPWIVRGAPSSDELHAAEPHLRHVLTLFPHLRVIVLVGRKAESAAAVVQYVVPNDVVLLRCPHPSPQNLRTRPEARIKIRTVLLEVRGLLKD
jgi:uracil-DNA glycosylase